MAQQVESEVAVFPNPAEGQRAAEALQSGGVAAENIAIINDPRRARDVVGNRLFPAIAVGVLVGAALAGGLAFLAPGAELVRSNLLVLALWIGIGAFIGFIAGDLGGRLIPRRDASLYQRRVEQGAVLLRVTCDRADRPRVRALLARAGAENVRSEQEAERPTP
ncbi:MAG TPA: hypothetical protein VFA01_02245 [Candidatus Dormibacteraeota bacterium]|jgi:hypothetical protein|nr:hypothetical protein [Candidatus Dormibacteraeota bacterium]